MSGKKVSLCLKQNMMTNFHSRLELDDDTILEDNFPEHDEDLRVNDRTLLKQAEINASYEISAPIFHEEYCIVVPVIKKRSYGIASNIAFPMICLGTIVLLKFFVTLSLKFDRRFWKMTILTQMLLGLTVHGHPKKSIERLVLAGLLFFAIVASVFVYNALSYMQMDYEKEVKFSALHELLEHKIKLQLCAFASGTAFLRCSDGATTTKKKSQNFICVRVLREAQYAHIQLSFKYRIKRARGHPREMCFHDE
ncbi:unnamed protein product [Trichogramma brassicae]|uniref:Uncharacterized protein n=1 Tax=Trichogramma brassicae TaxID=86971 RepID=A0A6H5IEA8_9HYME|nr:unnamed protein product [Trichogramma brassicae]